MDLFVFLLLILFIAMVVLSLFLIGKSSIPGVKPFIVCLLLVAVWNGTDAVDLLLYQIDIKSLLFVIKMAFIVYIPAFWLMTVLELTGRRSFRNLKNVILIVLPTITAVIVVTFRYNNWFLYDLSLISVSKYKVLQFSKGFWFWINACYNYLLNAISLGLLIKAAFSNQYIRKRQAVIMIVGMLIPIISDVMFVGNIKPFENLDLISISFWVSLLICVHGIFRYEFMNIVLVARERAFDDMDELMIVLDGNKRVVDMNKKALKVFDTTIQTVIGIPIVNIITDFSNYDFQNDHKTTLNIRQYYKSINKEVNYYGSVSSVKGESNNIIGYLILLYDITELTITQKKLKQANEELKRLYEELYKDSIKDGLTGVYNKKYITELLQTEIEKSLKAPIPLTIAIIDIDYFKKLNDRYGHLVGDAVLVKVAGLIEKELVGKGIVGRFGGEEFLILMPSVDLEKAYELCENIRILICNCCFEQGDMTVTVSTGMAELRSCDDINSILKRADEFLYQAKDNGRNMIEAAVTTM